ncbi:hypothetical protein ALQ33_101383 [Pseudomonas syringae pv. philadelphi]|uniref:Uncharacterized protein n=1 Tax=Pseudomonas syringae pv. philadelphi TaxID=251706 RepID=A0A3M3YH52_9PSED|nr:hypothetical protein ALQ33_101383 [Pseudomonas syringae pv. philadelphi]
MDYFEGRCVSHQNLRIDLAILRVVRRLCSNQPRKLTFGQIYTELIRCHSVPPAIPACVTTVDTMVREGLLTSAQVLEPDLSFPYPQHIISGLTEIGAASLADQYVTVMR